MRVRALEDIPSFPSPIPKGSEFPTNRVNGLRLIRRGLAEEVGNEAPAPSPKKQTKAEKKAAKKAEKDSEKKADYTTGVLKPEE